MRLIHTSLQPEGLNEDDFTDLSLLQLDAILTVHVQNDGRPGPLQYAHLLPPQADGKKGWRVEDVESIEGWDQHWTVFIRDLEGQFTRHQQLHRVQDAEGAILVALTLGKSRKAKRSLSELVQLAETAGFEVMDTLLCRRNKLDGRTCVGSGKLQEILVRAMHLGAGALVFDRELSPSQLRNIAQQTDLKVMDRTQLILDIFAQHAQSGEGKLQVELAQLRYRMPRLKIMDTAMSRLTGGIGGRGPGETKLEVNRRHALNKVTRLERQLKKLGQNRELRRSRRIQNRIPNVSIVGYTNAGKSTLLNRVTRSNVLVENKLFATLDPTSRRFRFPREREIIISDTVGFIHDLPKTLIQAFMATLEELEEAQLLLHVLDASDPDVIHQKKSVEQITEQLELTEKPTLLVWNKADVCPPAQLEQLLGEFGGIATSALTGEGLSKLLDAIERQLFQNKRKAEVSEEDEQRDPFSVI